MIKKITIGFIIILFTNNLMSQPYCQGDSITLNAINYVSGQLQWQYSYNNTNWYNIPGAVGLTYVFYPSDDIFLRLRIEDQYCIPSLYFTQTEFVEITPNPTQAFAGEDQLNIQGNTTNLDANSFNQEYENGTWGILSGEGGLISNPTNPNSEFSGVSGNEYLLRWIIYNPCGQTYDDVMISFAVEQQFECGDSLVDPRDNQVYPTVEIGNQCWMAKNLNIGQMINGNQNQTNQQLIEKYCYGDDPNNCDVYGGLYQWDQVMNYSTESGTQGICPPGWFVPTDEDFIELEMYIGMSESEVILNNTFRGYGYGTMLHPGGETGFNIQFGGARNQFGNFQFIEGGGSYEFGYLYFSNEAGNNAYRRCFRPDNTGIGRYNNWPKTTGLSLRCLKE